MQKLKRILWRLVRWTLAISLGYFAIVILILLGVSYTVGPKPKPEEEWQVWLVIGIELMLIFLTFIIFRSLFRKKKNADEPVVFSARKAPVQTVPELIVRKRFDERNPGFTAFFERYRIQKIGIDYLTYSDLQEDGSVYASRWFIFGFFPIIPISLDRICKGDKERKTHIPFLVSSSRLFEERLEIRSMPRRLKRLTFLQVYALLLPGMLALAGLLVFYLLHPDLGFSLLYTTNTGITNAFYTAHFLLKHEAFSRTNRIGTRA